MQHTITIAPDRCYQHTIPISAASTAVLITADPADSANTWCSLLVDGVYYHLVMWKHSIGRPEISAALDQALADVRAAILALGTPPLLPADAYVIGALERLAETEAMAARAARAAKLPDDAKFFQRAANAYGRALCHFLAGVRPTRTPNGYILPSQRPGEAPHKLTFDGDWMCSCAAGESMHWAKALLIGLEVAADMQRDGDDDVPALPTRLAEEDAALLALLA